MVLGDLFLSVYDSQILIDRDEFEFEEFVFVGESGLLERLEGGFLYGGEGEEVREGGELLGFDCGDSLKCVLLSLLELGDEAVEDVPGAFLDHCPFGIHLRLVILQRQPLLFQYLLRHLRTHPLPRHLLHHPYPPQPCLLSTPNTPYTPILHHHIPLQLVPPTQQLTPSSLVHLLDLNDLMFEEFAFVDGCFAGLAEEFVALGAFVGDGGEVASAAEFEGGVFGGEGEGVGGEAGVVGEARGAGEGEAAEEEIGRGWGGAV